MFCYRTYMVINQLKKLTDFNNKYFSAYFATKMSVNVINVGSNMYVRTHLKPIIIVFHQ